MKKLYLIGLLLPLITTVQVDAQTVRKCLSTEKNEVLMQQDPSLISKRKTLFDNASQSTNHNRLQKTNATIIIPVVVHIVYKDIADSLSEARIRSQINVLNEDFKRLNSDKINTPSAFSSLAADCEIEFRLADFDPDGNPTNGITYRKNNLTEFPIDQEDDIKTYSTGGTDPWNTVDYLNIWVGRIPDGTLGYAYLPSSHGESYDGVVILTDAFGVHNDEPFNLGRTATHEVGHYLGLEHIWGDTGCNNDDGVSDTPLQNDENYECPTFPTTDVCTSGNGVMFMNYMDYVNDACMNMFTLGQKAVMRSALENDRASLLSSPAIGSVAGVENTLDYNITLFPNPAKESVTLSITNIHSTEINLINSLGEVVFKTNSNSSEIIIPCTEFSKGIYTLSILSGEKTMTQKLVIID